MLTPSANPSSDLYLIVRHLHSRLESRKFLFPVHRNGLIYIESVAEGRIQPTAFQVLNKPQHISLDRNIVSQPTRMSQPPNENRTIQRFITTHNTDGKAVFSDAIPNEAPIREIGTDGNMTFSLMYTNQSFPANMDGEKDILTYQGYLTTPPKITIPGGSVCRVCDFAPGYLTVMHRTPSLDFGVCLEGEVELVLDSGETRVLKRGDVAVQRYVADRILTNIPQ